MAECIAPPEIPESDLLRHLGGERDLETSEHLQRCEHCTGRLEDLRRALAGLARKVYRAECPPAMELTGYHLGELEAGDRRRVQEHLALCAACREELAGFRQFLDATEIEPIEETGILERAGVWVSSLFAGGADRTSPAAAGLRGEAEVVRVYQAGEFQVTLSILPETGGSLSVTGLLSGVSPDGWTAELWHAVLRVSVVETNPGGEFHFEAVPPGAYTLILDGPQGEVHIQDLQI